MKEIILTLVVQLLMIPFAESLVSIKKIIMPVKFLLKI